MNLLRRPRTDVNVHYMMQHRDTAVLFNRAHVCLMVYEQSSAVLFHKSKGCFMLACTQTASAMTVVYLAALLTLRAYCKLSHYHCSLLLNIHTEHTGVNLHLILCLYYYARA
jgi:hypothetical protein